MQVKFINGPLKGKVLTVFDTTRKFVVPKDGSAKFAGPESIFPQIESVPSTTYIIRQENGEWIGEMEEQGGKLCGHK